MNTLVTASRLVNRFATERVRTAAFGAGARAFALGSQLIVLIVMSRLLPKADLGDVMIVFTLYRLISLALGSGLGSIVLYHVGRRAGDPVFDIQLMRSLSLVGAGIGLAAAAAVVVGAPAIAALFTKPGMAGWLVSMSPMIVFGTLLQITASSFDGRSQITRSIVITELLPNIIRLVGFGALAVLGIGGGWISAVLWGALALPWLADAVRFCRPGNGGFARLVAWDLRYGAWLGVYPLLGQQLQGIDMLLVATFFSSETAAEYSIASRLASFYPFLLQIVTRTATPKMGALIHDDRLTELNSEMQSLRVSALLLTSVLAGLIIGVAPIIASLSGDYMAALPIMVTLAVAPLIRTMFVGTEIVLRMRGHGGALAAVAAGASVVLCVVTWALHDVIGIYALPAAMALAATCINSVVAATSARWGIRIFDGTMLLPIGIASLVLVGVASELPPLPAALLASAFLLALSALGGLLWWRRARPQT